MGPKKKKKIGLKINSQTYCKVLEDTFFKKWYRKKATFKKAMTFMQDNAWRYTTAWLVSRGINDDLVSYLT